MLKERFVVISISFTFSGSYLCLGETRWVFD